MEKLVILGGGVAGLTAAVYTARANLSPLVVEGLQPGGQLMITSDVENFPGFPEGISGPELMERLRKQAEKFGTRFVGAAVETVDFTKRPFTLRLDDGQTLSAQSIIIATGASARYLGLESEKQLLGRGVSACAICDGAFYRGKPVAVVGGGDSALEEALFLTRFVSGVTVVHRRNQFRASKIMVDRVLRHPKIKVVFDSVVDEVLDVSQGVVTGLKLRNVQTGAVSVLPVDGVFVAVGHQVNTVPFQGQLEMDEQGYLRTTQTRTNVPGVFAAGDVQDRNYRQATTAAGTGCMAALEAERFLESQGQ